MENEDTFVTMKKSLFDKDFLASMTASKVETDDVGAIHICGKRECGSSKWGKKDINFDANVVCSSVIPGN